MLRLEHISVAYGKHEALHDVSLEVLPGRTTVILGANGAGKTTLLKTVAGLMRAQLGGRILFEGRSIENEPPHNIVALGIALVPEGRRLFGDMTVIDNLRLGAYTKHARADEEGRLERQLALFPHLAERRDQLAKTMSGGEQQMLAIARALMSQPKILLLDEPSLGLSPRLVKDLFSTLAKITHDGQAVLLVEQNAHQSLRLADRVYVLENGRVHSAGSPEEIRQDKVIQQAYLGLKAPHAADTHRAPAAPAAATHYPGGFVNPSARTVAPSSSVPVSEERPMSATITPYATGGFYNPYARSISEPAAAPAERPAPAHHEAPRPERADASGGFVNPLARSVAPKR